MRIDSYVRSRSLALMVLFGLSLGSLAAQTASLPPAEAGAKDRLNSSPRHGEWARYPAAGGDSVDAWVVYPERKEKAPVVVVIHEIYGLTDWVRAVADQFAAEGFIAVAPDLLSGKGPGGKGSVGMEKDTATALIRNLGAEEVVKRLDATAEYSKSLPSAATRFAVVGYCWGGGISFAYATARPDLSAAIVFYGTSPAAQSLAAVKAPVLGLYGGNDNRVNATIPAASNEMQRLGKRYETEIYQGAGHGFLRQQDGQNGANMAATEKAWARVVNFLKAELETRTSGAARPGDPLLAAFSAADDCIDECASEPLSVAAN
ncbi:MAG: dienelactone hydrolase family protein [Treponemataceae bacterium]